MHACKCYRGHYTPTGLRLQLTSQNQTGSKSSAFVVGTVKTPSNILCVARVSQYVLDKICVAAIHPSLEYETQVGGQPLACRSEAAASRMKTTDGQTSHQVHLDWGLDQGEGCAWAAQIELTTASARRCSGRGCSDEGGEEWETHDEF